MPQENVPQSSEITKKLEDFFGKHKAAIFKKGDLILRPSDGEFGIFYIKKGSVRLYNITKSGREVTYHIANPGTYFPIMLVFAGKKNTYYFEAMERTEVYIAPTDQVLQFIKSDSQIQMDIIIRFSNALSGFMLKIEDLLTDSAYGQVASLLRYFARKFGIKTETGMLIKLRLTHTEIASWLGISRETVTRQLKQMQEKGELNYQDGFFLIKNVK